jgi:hypothetical protein
MMMWVTEVWMGLFTMGCVLCAFVLYIFTEMDVGQQVKCRFWPRGMGTRLVINMEFLENKLKLYYV